MLVMELLERNIETVFRQEQQTQRRSFSLMTIVLIIDQMVSE